MDRKHICFFSLLIFILIFSTSFVCASDDAPYSNETISSTDLGSSSNDTDYKLYLEDSTINDDDSNENMEGNKLSASSSLGSSHTVSGSSFSDIRESLNEAKNGDTIILSGTYHNDNKQISIKKDNITIKGNSATNKAVLDAEGSEERILIIYGNHILLENIVFKNVDADVWGGAISNHGDFLTICNCEFINNKAEVGAIVLNNDSSHATITNCLFKGNIASYLHEDKGGYGGALDSHASHGQIINCTFTDNQALESGGAVYMKIGENNTIEGCTFTGNTAENKGGAFYQSTQSFNATIIGSRFTNNTSKNDGGAIYAYCQLNIISTDFTGNSANNNGGALYIQGISSICDCSFNENTATQYGGSAYNTNQSTITGSNFTGNNAEYGGAIYNKQTLELNSSQFKSNKAENGSALYNVELANISSTLFKDNQAHSYLLDTSNYSVRQGQTVNISAYLEYGDNYAGIYSQVDLSIDDAVPELCLGAPDEKIILELNKRNYSAKTNKSGIAVFKIATSSINPSNYTFNLYHKDTKISTRINGSGLLEILKDNTTHKKDKKKIKKKKKKTNKKKGKKAKKNNKAAHKKAKKSIKKRAKTVKKIKSRKGIRLRKSLKKVKLKQLSKPNGIKVRSSLEGTRNSVKINNKYKREHANKEREHLNGLSNKLIKLSGNSKVRISPGLSLAFYTLGTFIKAGTSSKNIWDFINYPFLTIPNYNKTIYNIFGSKFAPYVEGFVDLAIGIDENGQMSIGQLIINILSLVGVGLIGKLGKLGGAISKLFKGSKYLKYFQILNNIPKYYKYVSRALEWVNNGVLLLSKFYTGVASTIYSLSKLIPGIKNFNPAKSKIIKKILKNKTVKKLWSKVKNSKAYKLITKKLNSLKNNITNNIKNLENNGKKLFNKAKKSVSKIKDNIITKIKQTTDKLKNSSIARKAKNVWNKIKEIKIVKKSTEKLVKFKNRLSGNVKKSIDKLKNNTITNNAKKTWKQIKNNKTVQKTINKLNNVKKGVSKNVKNSMNNMKTKGQKFLKKGERIGKKAAKTLKRNGKRISQFFDNDLRNSYSLITANYEKVKNSIFKKKTKNTKRKVLQARPKTKIIRKRTKTKQITKHRTIHKKVQSLKKSAKNMIKKLKFW